MKKYLVSKEFFIFVVICFLLGFFTNWMIYCWYCFGVVLIEVYCNDILDFSKNELGMFANITGLIWPLVVLIVFIHKYLK